MSPVQKPPNERETPLRHHRVVVLEPITRDHAAVLDELFELYAYDFSEHVPLELKPSGRFEVSAGRLWWTEPEHYPFFLRVDGRLAGFALARRGSRVQADPDIMDVAEFFVVRGERRQHVGHRAARALLTRFPGYWEVRVRVSNPPALAFWSAVLEEVAIAQPNVSAFSGDDVEWYVLRAQVR